MSKISSTITLTHEQKVALLRAVECGEIDLSIFGNQYATVNTMTPADVEAELCRLDALADRQYLANVADAMREFASGEITLAEYTARRVDYVTQHPEKY